MAVAIWPDRRYNRGHWKGIQSFVGRLGIFTLALLVASISVLCGAFALALGLNAVDVPLFVTDGYVAAPKDARALELVGVPGDQIELRLLMGHSGTDFEHSVLFARLQDEASDFQTTIPVPSRNESDNDENWLRGRLTVPGVPGKPNAVFKGVISGLAKTDDGEPVSLEVPVYIRTIEPGTGLTSGAAESGSDLLDGLLIVAFLVAVAFGTALLYGHQIQQQPIFGRPRNFSGS